MSAHSFLHHRIYVAALNHVETSTPPAAAQVARPVRTAEKQVMRILMGRDLAAPMAGILMASAMAGGLKPNFP
jgi:hypothetical protein